MKIQYLLLFGIALIILGSGLIISSNYTYNKSSKEQLVDSLETVILRKDSIIKDLEEQVEILSEEGQIKEAEISYWGQKYDSVMNKY
jgi:cell division protein FtsL